MADATGQGIGTRPIAGVVAGLLAACLAGCASKPPPAPPPPPPVPLKLVVHVAADANPDVAGRGSPVVVRVYQLRTNDAFKNQDLEPLYFKDKELLAADLVTREEWTLKPGETHEARWLVPPDVHAVELFAALREYRGLPWKVELPIPPPPPPAKSKKAAPAEPPPVQVEIDRTGVHLQNSQAATGR
jgi:type VI secretion system protein VasD